MKTYKLIKNWEYSILGEQKQKWDFEPCEVNGEFIEEQAISFIHSTFNIDNPTDKLIEYIKDKEDLETGYLEDERDYLLEDFREQHNISEIVELCEVDVYNGWFVEATEFENHLLVKCGAGNSAWTTLLEIGEENE